MKEKINSRKPQFIDGFNTYIKELGHNSDNLSSIQRSQYFVRFYAERILAVISHGLISTEPEELDTAIVDGTGDWGVDFISRQDGRVVLIQAKWQSRDKRDKTEDKGEFERFCSVLKRLYKGRGQRFNNSYLETIVADIDWVNDRFELYYITMGKAAPESRRREEDGQESFSELPDIDNRTSIYLKDCTDLNTDYRDALCYQEGIQEEVDIRLESSENNIAWITYENSENRKCYIGRISSKQIDILVKRYRHRLFSLNIRNYLGELTTNKRIIATAMECPGEFFFYNNGISAVAANIDMIEESNILRCRGFSIINGAQTANSLHKACNRSRESASQAEVLIRISEISPKKDNEEGGFLDCITKYNNTQNTIKLGDFRSNDAVQLSLRHHFDRCALDGKKYCYQNKRDKEQAQKKIPIGMEDFAKTIHAFSFGPVDYYGGTSYLFDTTSEGGYVKVFGDGNYVWEEIDSETFERLSGIWFLCSAINEHLLQEKKVRQAADTSDIMIKPALERRMLVYYMVGELIRQKYGVGSEKYERILKRLSDPNKWLSKGAHCDSTMRDTVYKYTKAGCDLLVRAYRSASKNPSFVQRNWFRQKEHLSDLREEIKASSFIIEELPKFL